MEKIDKNCLVEVKNLSFSYGDKALLRNLSFKLGEGEVLAILGESGSGKTSLLKLIAGLLQPKSGEISFLNEVVKGPEQKLIPGHENIKLVNQEFDLMPYLSVSDNIIRDGLDLSLSSRKRLLGHYQKSLKLNKIKGQQASQTSGGQKQRVALATVLLTKPDVILLDEPFSNIDFALKQDILQRIRTDWKTKGMIVVAHEPTDILSIADRALILQNGRLVQEGGIKEVYNQPINRYVGELLGPINELTPEDADKFGISTQKSIWLRPHRLYLDKKGVEVKLIEENFHGSYKLLKVNSDFLSQEYIIQVKAEEELSDTFRLNIRK